MAADKSDRGAQETPTAKDAPKRRFAWCGIQRTSLTLGMAALIAGTVIAHSLLLVFHRWDRAAAAVPSQEASLGEFCYVARSASPTGIQGAKFELSIALLDDMAPVARLQLAAHQRKVQQNVEELLRRAHPGDFDDPTLAGLKRHLQTQINDALGVRVISEVLITDLVLEPQDSAGEPATPQLAADQTTTAAMAP